ncbi:MAG: hypothetical protein NTW20_03060 [Rhodobacterales bacterium]|nr:hypothetical protein [Rhodobacterales bacterium]
MRWIFVVLALASGAASAKDCEPPKRVNEELSGVIKFSECMIDKVAGLERENAELRKELDKIQTALTKFPGEMRNEDGRVTRSGGENLMQATFITGARRGAGPAALAIDQKALEAICAVGCTVNLVLAAEALRKEDPGSVNTAATCSLRYTAKSGTWSQGGGCGDPVSGVDGDGKPPGKSGGEVIATVGDACVLADSEPGRSVDAAGQLLGADRAKGIYLIAAPALWTGTEARFRCEMKISR